MASSDDTGLIRRFKDGEASAFAELVEKYQDRIYTLCRYMIADADEAEDAAQDALIKVYKGLKDYRPDAQFYTWFYRIAVNTCLDYRKRSRPVQEENDRFLEEVAALGPSPEELVESKETGRLIQAALARLPEKLRAVIVLKEIEGLSYDQIAEVVNTSVGTVKSRISRAREELQKLLRKPIGR